MTSSRLLRSLRAFHHISERHSRRSRGSRRFRLHLRHRSRGCYRSRCRCDAPGLARQPLQALGDAAEIGPDLAEIPLDPTDVERLLARSLGRSLERYHLTDGLTHGRLDGCGSLDHGSARRLAAGLALLPQPLEDFDRRPRITRATPESFRWDFRGVFQCIVAESCIRNACLLRNVHKRQQLSCPCHFFNLQNKKAERPAPADLAGSRVDSLAP